MPASGLNVGVATAAAMTSGICVERAVTTRINMVRTVSANIFFWQVLAKCSLFILTVLPSFHCFRRSKKDIFCVCYKSLLNIFIENKLPSSTLPAKCKAELGTPIFAFDIDLGSLL